MLLLLPDCPSPCFVWSKGSFCHLLLYLLQPQTFPRVPENSHSRSSWLSLPSRAPCSSFSCFYSTALVLFPNWPCFVSYSITRSNLKPENLLRERNVPEKSSTGGELPFLLVRWQSQLWGVNSSREWSRGPMSGWDNQISTLLLLREMSLCLLLSSHSRKTQVWEPDRLSKTFL